MFQIIAPSIYKYDEDHEKTEKLFEVSPFWFVIKFSISSTYWNLAYCFGSV